METETTSASQTADPKTKAELLQRIQREWERLWRMVEPLSAEQMTVPDTGGWSVKDNLAHLAAWEQFMLLAYLGGVPGHTAFGIDEATFRAADETGLNEIIYQRNKNLSASEAADMLRRSHAQVLAEIEGRSFEDLLVPLSPDDPQRRPVLGWVIGNTYGHYDEHMGYMEKGIDRLKRGAAREAT